MNETCIVSNMPVFKQRMKHLIDCVSAGVGGPVVKTYRRDYCFIPNSPLFNNPSLNINSCSFSQTLLVCF